MKVCPNSRAADAQIRTPALPGTLRASSQPAVPVFGLREEHGEPLNICFHPPGSSLMMGRRTQGCVRHQETPLRTTSCRFQHWEGARGDVSAQGLVHVLLCLMYLRGDSLCQLHIPASNGCVIRLQPICVVSAQIRACPLKCAVPWPGALLAHRLMKFTSSKADVFPVSGGRLLQEETRNFRIVLSAVQETTQLTSGASSSPHPEVLWPGVQPHDVPFTSEHMSDTNQVSS